MSVPGTSPFASIADELGIAHQTLRNWVQQADVDAGNRDGLRTEERQELRRFQREVKRLRMERDILKKRRPSSPTRARVGRNIPLHRCWVM